MATIPKAPAWLAEKALEASEAGSGEPAFGKKADEGERNDVLYRAMCSVRRTVDDADEMLNHALAYNAINIKPPLPRSEVETIVGSVMKLPGGTATSSSGTPLPPSVTGQERRNRLGAVTLDGIVPAPPPPMLLDRLDPIGATMLFGPGGVGKGVLSTSWIAQLVGIGHRVLILDYENHREEWTRRLAGLGCDRSKVLHVAPLAPEWGGVRGPIWKAETDIRALAVDFAATYVVVDSVGFACAGLNPSDAEAAIQYNEGISYIGLPSLSLAHVTKAGDMAMPFGSMFWHAAARLTWSMEAQGPGVAVLTMRKSNNYEKLPKMQVSSEWDAGMPTRVDETPQHQALVEQVHYVLSVMGKTSLSDLVDEMNDGFDDEGGVKKEAVRKAMTRASDRFRSSGKGAGALWEAV